MTFMFKYILHLRLQITRFFYLSWIDTFSSISFINKSFSLYSFRIEYKRYIINMNHKKSIDNMQRACDWERNEFLFSIFYSYIKEKVKSLLFHRWRINWSRYHFDRKNEIIELIYLEKRNTNKRKLLIRISN